jgi:hypothetical protein
MLAKVLPGWRAMPECEGDDEDNILVDETGVVWYYDLNLVEKLQNLLTDDEWDKYVHKLSTVLHPNAKIRTYMQATDQQRCNALYPILSARKARGG